MGLMEMMKYNIDALSAGEKLLGSVITMVLGMATCLIALTILIICIKIMSVFFGGKKDKGGKSSPASSAPVSTPKSGPTASAITLEDNSELVAVITAAIAAISGSSNFVIRNITEKKRPPLLSNWVTTGRFEAFNSRKTVKK